MRQLSVCDMGTVMLTNFGTKVVSRTGPLSHTCYNNSVYVREGN